MTAALDEAFRRNVSTHQSTTTGDADTPRRPDPTAGLVRHPGCEPARGCRRAGAAGARRRLLHDQLRRAREQRSGGHGAAARRPCAAALPVRRLLPGPRRQVERSTPVRDILQGLMGSIDEPIAGGRHKVFGHHQLGDHPADVDHRVAPAARGRPGHRHRARSPARIASPWPDDAVVVCSFGDASANHSTAAGAVNTAINTAYRSLPVPLLLVCEDNGLGISVRTPDGWIEHAYGSRPGLRYFRGRRCRRRRDARAASEAADRRAPGAATGLPAPHHGPLPRPRRERCRDHLPAADRAGRATSMRDPLLATARALLDRGWATTWRADRRATTQHEPRSTTR